MSTIKDNIRRIAETEELKKLIAELLNEGEVGDKSGIPKTEYFAYVGTNGGVNSSNQPPSSDVGSTEEEVENTDDSIEEDDEDTPGGGGGSSDTFSEDLEDIIDDGLQVGDVVREITGLFDCGTSNEGVLYSDLEFRPPVIADLTDYKPSDWSDGNDPRESQWRSGVYYQFTGTTLHESSNPYGAVDPALAEFDTNDPPNAPHTLVSIESYDIDTEIDGANLEATLNRVAGQFTANITIRKTGCTVGVDPHCPSSQPTNDWPEDGKHQLKFDGAQFQTNEFEPSGDLVPGWQNNPSKVTACDSSGGQASFQGTNDGNMILNIESGANNGDSYIIGNDGVVIEKTTDTSSFLPSS